MTKRGKLTLREKYAIQGMLHNNMDIEEIATFLDRSTKIVENYVNGELDRLHNTIANAQLEQLEKEVERRQKEALSPPNEQPNISSKDVQNVFTRLKDAGLLEKDIVWVINKVFDVYEKTKSKLQDADHLYTECIKNMRAGHFITKRTQSGKGGVAIMSPAASTRMDESAKQSRGSRSTKGCIYNPSTDEIQ